MKKVIVALLLVITSSHLSAQLTNSKWKGTLRGENPQEVIFDFKKDTAVVYNAADNSHIETMTYSVKDGVLTLLKVDGVSDCDSSTPGKYKVVIEKEVMYLKLLDDTCIDRSGAVEDVKWTKSKAAKT